MALKGVGAIAGNLAVEALTDHGASADSTTISDANFDPANAIDCAGWKKIAVFCRFNAGTNPTATLEPLVRATPQPVVGGNGWARLAKTAALGDLVVAIIEVMGRNVFQIGRASCRERV